MVTKKSVLQASSWTEIPKSIRKSPIITKELASKVGREMTAAALTAAAAVLVGERREIADTAKQGAKLPKAVALWQRP